ncbi:MAG: DEAD/DEAH box helicase [Clostridia bacterium]
MKFTELNLPQYIIDAVAKQGFEEATEIQSKCLPLIMEGKDVIGKSQTGSGKTIAYAIPAIEKVDTTRSCVQVLVVCPTRELAIQVCEEFKKITAFKESCKVVPIFGGNSMDRQKMALKNGAKIVVGTPGRIMDHLRRRTLKMDFLKMAVLDEADEMLNMGFKEDIETILAKVNPERQTVMFSATLPAPILKITNEFMKNPILIEVGNKNETTKLIKQSFVFHEKKDALIQLCLDMKPTTSIIFCNTKKMVDDVTDMLVLNGLKAVSLHGDMRQSARQKAMQELKSGKVNYLVATDVAARGIDVKNVDIIFNYDIPKDVEYYIHRIGRTGRAGLTGVAISFVTTRMQIKQLALIEKETKATINQILLNGDTAQDKYLQETNFLNEKSSRGVSFSGERKKNFSAPSFKNNFTGSHQGKSQNFNISKRTNSKPLGKSFNNEFLILFLMLPYECFKFIF